MNANPMEEQIGRLVGNLLAGGGEIFLPGVGSIYTERQGARRLNRRTVLPPSRTVAFTSQQRGVSLVDEIARVMREAGGYENPEAEAQAVYDRWIARVHRADLLTVEGVGELKFKNFIPDEAFDLRLNPQGREPVRVRVQRRFDWPLWVGIAAIGIAAVYGGREFLLLYPEAPEAAAVTEIPAASDSFGTLRRRGARLRGLPFPTQPRNRRSPKRIRRRSRTSRRRCFRAATMSCWGFSAPKRTPGAPCGRPRPRSRRSVAGFTVSGGNSWFRPSRRTMPEPVRSSSACRTGVSPTCGPTPPADGPCRVDNPGD